MRERPILFSGPMVRALLAGTKTQTRRIAKPVKHPDLGNLYDAGALVLEREPQHVIERACPYGKPFDRLWVRETFVQGFPYDAQQDRHLQYDEEGNELPMKTWYRATDPAIGWADDDGWQTNVPWRPSIHMPRTACRLVLQITDVRIQRLQTISEADAKAEGCAPAWLDANDNETVHALVAPTYRQGFARLWRDINGAESWQANPWVWVVEFRVLAHPDHKDGGAVNG